MRRDTRSTQAPRHIAVLGAGAVGCTLATFLRHAGHRVTLVTRTGAPIAPPLRVQDDIGQRELDLVEVETCRAAEMPRQPDHLVICTRAEQLEAAIDSIAGRLDAAVPVTVAAATLDDLNVIARARSLGNPMLRMGVGFAAWPVAEQRYRVFSLRPRGGSAVASESGEGEDGRVELASILSRAGLPTQAAPTRLFRWIFHTTLAVEIGRLLGFREVGWDLDALAARPKLLSRCSEAMREAAQIARDRGGPVGWALSVLPRSAFLLMLERSLSSASDGFREVWRHHGPKTEGQLDFVARQLIRLAHGRPTAALSGFMDGSSGRSDVEEPPRAARPTPPTREAIARRAHELWQAAGRPQGQDQRFWFEAESDLSRKR